MVMKASSHNESKLEPAQITDSMQDAQREAEIELEQAQEHDVQANTSVVPMLLSDVDNATQVCI
jgi:hypothetical protein